MREQNIINAPQINVFCTMEEYTEDPTQIKIPIYIHGDIVSAQKEAGIPSLYSHVSSIIENSYVYQITVTDATYDELNPMLKVLISGNITIEEIVNVRRNGDGTIHRLGRNRLQ